MYGSFVKWTVLVLALLFTSCQGGLGWFSRDTGEPVHSPVEQEEESASEQVLICPDLVRRAVVEGDYGAALVLLEVEPEPWGICGARALIGLHRYEEALAMLAGTVHNNQLDAPLRTTACGLSLIASVGLMDEGGAAHYLMNCPSQLPLEREHFLLLEDWGLIGVAVADTFASSGRYLSAVISAAELLSQDLLDHETQQWMTYSMFEWSRTLTFTERSVLEQSETPLLSVVFSYASMMAFEGESSPEFLARAETLNSELESLGALAQRLNVDYITHNREAVRPPLVGALIPLSGGYSPIGRAVLEGMFLSQGVFGEPDSGESRLLIADMGETAGSALEGLEALEENNVLAVITLAQPNQLPSIVERASQLNVPLLVISIDGDRSVLSERAYCLAPDPTQEGRLLAQYAAAHGHISVGVVEREPSSPYLRSLVTAFLSEAAVHGMEAAGPYPFLAVGALRQESAAQIAEMLSGEHLDAVLLADSFGRAMTLSSYLAQAQIWSDGLLRFPAQNQQTVLFLGNSTWHDPRLLQSEPNYLLGSVIPEGIFTEPPSLDQEQFRAGFARVFHRQPLLWHAYGFDAMSIMEEIVDRNGVRTRSGVHQGLTGLSPIPGITGEIWFDEQLNRNQPVRLLMVTETGFESQ